MTQYDIPRWAHRRPSHMQRLGRALKRLSRKQKYLALALAAGVVFGGGGTAWALTTGEPANCVGGVPTVDENGVTHLAVDCTFAAPMVTVTVPVPGPTVTVPGPTFTETTTITVTAPPSVSTTTVTVTPSPTRPPVTTPPATTPPPTTPPSAGWPDASNTGVPAGVVLTTYTGPCTITAANTVIDSKTVNCTLSIRANNVTVRNSRINGGIENGTGNQPNRSFTVTDSRIVAPSDTTGIGESNYTATRVEVTGGNRGANCYDTCTIRDSYFHGNRITGNTHASGVRAGMRTSIVHNTITCDTPDINNDGGCSADVTMYPDFSIVTDVLVQDNQLLPTQGYFCAYGGTSKGKPYTNAAGNATYIRFIGNVFSHGPSGKCGAPRDGTPLADYAPATAANHNVYSGNRWDSGEALNF